MAMISFKVDAPLFREDLKQLVDHAPVKHMYAMTLEHLEKLVFLLQDIASQIERTPENIEPLSEFDIEVSSFLERKKVYMLFLNELEDRASLDAPLFKGDYSGYNEDGEAPIPYPEAELPARMAQNLIDSAKGDRVLYEAVAEEVKSSFSLFWSSISDAISRYSSDLESGEESPEGRRYGFWPIVIGATLIGSLGAAAGYSASKADSTESYVHKEVDSTKEKGKIAGVAFIGGFAVAALIALRNR